MTIHTVSCIIVPYFTICLKQSQGIIAKTQFVVCVVITFQIMSVSSNKDPYVYALCIHICLHTYTHIHIYIHTYIHTHIYIYIYI